MARCSGTTKAGRRCSITANSTMTDDMGRLVAQPLRCGGQFCVLHAKPFVVRPAAVTEAMVVVFLDLVWGSANVCCDIRMFSPQGAACKHKHTKDHGR